MAAVTNNNNNKNDNALTAHHNVSPTGECLLDDGEWETRANENTTIKHEDEEDATARTHHDTSVTTNAAATNTNEYNAI